MIGVERLRELRDIVAVIVAERGAAFLPILHRLEAEIEKAQVAEDAILRAREIAARTRFKPMRAASKP